VKYAKLARSQISATVSGYNCGNANVLRVAAGDFSWSAALFPSHPWNFAEFSPLRQSCLHVIAVCLFA